MTNPEFDNLINKARKKRDAGEMETALGLAEKAKALDPGNPEAYQVIGQCQRFLGNYQEAVRIFEFLIGHFPDEADLYAELGMAKYDAGEKKAGYNLAKKAMAMAPDSQFALEALGLLACDYLCWPKAIEVYEKLTKMYPDHPLYYIQLVKSLCACFRFEDAIEAFRPYLELKGRSHENLKQMGMLYFTGRLFEEALPWFEEAEKADPGNEEAVFYQARCHIQFGDLATGEKLALKALSINPSSVHTLTLLNELKNPKIGDENLKTLFEKLEKNDFEKPIEKALTHLFLGKYFHKRKEYDTAFSHFKAANDERFKIFSADGLVYDKKLMEGNFAETRKIFTRERMKKMAGNGSDSEVPVLIVAMPRSGTTLLEQIISSHTKAHGAGELTALNRIFFDLNYKINEDLNRPIEEIIRENAAEWAEIYLKGLKVPEGKIRATEKMPVNFLHLGLFQAMFPKARAIYIRRHPLDICMSMYSNHLSGSYVYTSRFDTLAHYFNLHASLMNHWREHIDMKYLEVSYSELVENPEIKAREIIDFCGLDWEDKVLEFYKGRKAAYTISQVQVSEPINKKGLGRWKPYKKYIGALIEGLDENIVGPLGVEG